MPTWFCHFADIWLVSGCGSGISCKASGSTDLRVISSNTFKQKAFTVTSERAQFHRQRLSCLSVDRMNTDAVFPQQQPDVSLTWGSAHFNHTHFTDSRSRSHLGVRNASWENHLEEELWIKSCSERSSQRSRNSLIGYLQYVNHVTQQRLLVVSSTDQVVIQCHQFKLMSVSEKTNRNNKNQNQKIPIPVLVSELV